MREFETARFNMVESQIHPNSVTDPRILSTMGTIAREAFVPAPRRAFAYHEGSIEIAPGEDGGAPRYLMGAMPFARLVQLAAIRPGELVLDIGCGSGYSAAVLSHLTESVVALESDEKLAGLANDTLTELGIDNVAVVTGPLAQGYAKQGPYDVILIEGAVPEAPGSLFPQLKDGGRLVTVMSSGPMGKAIRFIRSGEVTSGEVAFDANVPVLPGFEIETEFVF